jgi:hypothetical protein
MVEEANNARRTGPALEAMYQFLLWLIPTVDKFPRARKFTLGDRIEQTALDVQDRLIAATYTVGRDSLLAEANLGLERLRHLIRLSFDLRCLDARRYEHAARALDEVGRMVGGWVKAHRARKA